MAEAIQWTPNNGSEFLLFVTNVCAGCVKCDACELLDRGMDAGLGIGETPAEWRHDGPRVFCTEREAPATQESDDV